MTLDDLEDVPVFGYDPDDYDYDHYEREPDEPDYNCWDCQDTGVDYGGARCRTCRPIGRQLRRIAHREWQRRDRARRPDPRIPAWMSGESPF